MSWCWGEPLEMMGWQVGAQEEVTTHTEILWVTYVASHLRVTPSVSTTWLEGP
jgi:hypothetical protein